VSSLVANGLATLAARLVGPLLSFAIAIGVARVCGPEVLGSYAYLLALLAVFQTAASGGLTGLLTREFAARPEDTVRYLRSGRTLAAATGTVAAIGYVAVARLLARTDNLAATLLLATTLVPSAWISVHEAYFMATRTHHRLALVAAGENALKLGLALLTFRGGGGLAYLCAGVAVSRALALGVSTAMVARAGARGGWRPAPAVEVRKLAVELAPFALVLVFSMTYFRLDVLLVEALLGPGRTGVYSAAVAFYTAALVIPDSAMAAVYPRLAARFRESSHSYADATLVAVRLVSAGLVPVSIGLICLAGPLLRLSYGGRYADASPALRLLAASLPIHAANAALGQALLAGRLQRAMARMTFLAMVVHGGLTLVLLPRVGIVGAPISLVASSLLFMVGAGWEFHREVSRLVLTRSTLARLTVVAGPIVVTLLSPAGWTYLSGAAGLAALGLAAPGVLLRGTGVVPWAPAGLRKGPA